MALVIFYTLVPFYLYELKKVKVLWCIVQDVQNALLTLLN